jgi:ABC-2 type transport system ATP-binding protein
LSELALAADKVVIVDRGKLVKIATIDELRRGATPRSRVRSPQADRLAALLAQKGAAVEREPDGVLLVSLTTEEIGHLAADNGIPLYELVEQTATLEEAFFEATGGAPEGGPGWVS